MVRFNIPQRLSSKLKPRILNASEIIIMRACVCVSLLAASVSLSEKARCVCVWCVLCLVCVCCVCVVDIHCAERMH